MNKKERINSILAAWNPIGVPSSIAMDEYKSYVEGVIAVGDDFEQMVAFLEKIIVVEMGLDYSDDNLEQKTEIMELASSLVQSSK